MVTYAKVTMTMRDLDRLNGKRRVIIAFACTDH